MGWLKKSLKFTGNAFGGGFLRDALGGGTLTNNKEIQAQVALLNKQKDATRLSGAKALAFQRRQVPLIRSSYQKLNENTLALAADSKQQLLGGVPGARVDALRGLESNGMAASNLAPLAERGIRGDLTRAFSKIDSVFGGQASQNAAEEVSALSGIDRGSAALTMQGQGMENDLVAQIVNALQHKKSMRKKGLLDVVGAAAPFIGAFAGGLPSPGSGQTLDEGDDGGS